MIKLQKRCEFCKKVIIEDFEKFLKENKEKYIECPYCKFLNWIGEMK